jgi:hypothetical protein
MFARAVRDTPPKPDCPPNAARRLGGCSGNDRAKCRTESLVKRGEAYCRHGGPAITLNAGTPINRIPDLAGKTIALRQGTTNETRLNEALKQKLVNATDVPIADANAGITMLESGSVDACAGDKVKLIGRAAMSKGPAKFSLPGEELSVEPPAFALLRNDVAMRPPWVLRHARCCTTIAGGCALCANADSPPWHSRDAAAPRVQPPFCNATRTYQPALPRKQEP